MEPCPHKGIKKNIQSRIQIIGLGDSVLLCSSVCQHYFLEWHITEIFVILNETLDYEAILHKHSAKC